METQIIGRGKRQKPYGFSRELFRLAISGGIVFWMISILTSLLPLAANYRAAFSNWRIQAVWIASLPMGLMIGFCVSYCFLRLLKRAPTKSPVRKAVMISSAALIAATVLIDLPMMLRESGGALYYFMIGVVFNAVRFLSLGITIGYQYKKRYG